MRHPLGGLGQASMLFSLATGADPTAAEDADQKSFMSFFADPSRMAIAQAMQQSVQQTEQATGAPPGLPLSADIAMGAGETTAWMPGMASKPPWYKRPSTWIIGAAIVGVGVVAVAVTR